MAFDFNHWFGKIFLAGLFLSYFFWLYTIVTKPFHWSFIFWLIGNLFLSIELIPWHKLKRTKND